MRGKSGHWLDRTLGQLGWVSRAHACSRACYESEMSALDSIVSQNVRDTLAIAMEHTDEHAALVVADHRTELSRLLALAYGECLPKARIISFDPLATDLV